MMEKEIRVQASGVVGLREDGDGEPRVEGYVNEFGKLSGDLGGFREMTERGAFKSSVEARQVVALWQHKSDDPIGRQDNGLVELREDDTGLWFAIDRAALTERQFELIANGTVRNMSFGFYTRSDRWEKRDGEDVRILEDVDLLEISPVTFPAYPDSSAAVRAANESHDAWVAEQRTGRDATAELRKLELDEQDAAPVIAKAKRSGG